jgi:hypothetical protein
MTFEINNPTLAIAVTDFLCGLRDEIERALKTPAPERVVHALYLGRTPVPSAPPAAGKEPGRKPAHVKPAPAPATPVVRSHVVVKPAPAPAAKPNPAAAPDTEDVPVITQRDSVRNALAAGTAMTLDQVHAAVRMDHSAIDRKTVSTVLAQLRMKEEVEQVGDLWSKA